MNPLRFSIITVCRNAESCIERTIQSVIHQSWANLQYVIVDGGSTDRTCELVKGFGDKISSFISEQDSGIYQAMNKGIGLADGEILLFLNAGDTLFNPDVLKNVQAAIQARGGDSIDVFHGKLILYYEDSGDGYLWESGPYSLFKAYRGSIPHPATFYLKKAFEKNGLFDESFKIAGDYEWAVRGIVKNSLNFNYIPVIVSVFYQGGISSRPDQQGLNRQEKRKSVERHIAQSSRIYFWILNRFRKILGL